MAIKIKNTKDITSDGVNIVLYGESGVGKTKLLETLENNIILSADRGLMTLKRNDIDYIDISCMNDVNESYNLVQKSKYDHITFDSLSEIAEVVLWEFQSNLERANKGKDKRQAYGELAEAFGAMIRKFRDIKGKNVIFICKTRYIYDEDELIIGYTPMLPGKVLPHGIPYLTDEVFAYIKENNKQRYILTEGERKHRSPKDRSGSLKSREYGADKFVGPNLNDIINRILEKDTKNG